MKRLVKVILVGVIFVVVGVMVNTQLAGAKWDITPRMADQLGLKLIRKPNGTLTWARKSYSGNRENMTDSLESPEQSLINRNNAIMKASSSIGLSRTGQIVTPSGTRAAQIITPQGVKNGVIVTNSQNNNEGRYTETTGTQQPSAMPQGYVRIISGRKLQMLQQKFSQIPNGQALFEKLFAPYGDGYVRIYSGRTLQIIQQKFSQMPNGQVLFEKLFAPYGDGYVRIYDESYMQRVTQKFSQIPNGQVLFEKLFAPFDGE